MRQWPYRLTRYQLLSENLYNRSKKNLEICYQAENALRHFQLGYARRLQDFVLAAF